MTPPSSFEITMNSYWMEISKLVFIVHKPAIREKRFCHMMYPHVTWLLMDDVNCNWKSSTWWVIITVIWADWEQHPSSQCLSRHCTSSTPASRPAPLATSPEGIRLKENSLGNTQSRTANPSLVLRTYFSHLMPPHGCGPLKICYFSLTFHIVGSILCKNSQLVTQLSELDSLSHYVFCCAYIQMWIF